MTRVRAVAWASVALLVMSAGAAEREIVIDGPAGKLAGTLLTPDAATAPVPAIVFITGSGAQDRDEAVFGHRPFKQLADALAAGGIASLRCDDRGVAKSTGDFSTATTLDFVRDAKAQLAWLRTHPGIDPHRVGVIGHSEGGLIGALLAGASDGGVDFAVLLAPPGIKGREILTGQTEDLYRAAHLEAGRVAYAVERHRELMDAVEAGLDDAALDEALRALVEAQLELVEKNPPSADRVQALARAAKPGLLSPWMRNFISLDPAPSFAACRVPVLAVFGAKDTQVAPSRNVPAIKAACKDAAVTPEIVVLPGLNHLFQRCATGLPDEYAKIKSGVEPEVLTLVTDWVTSRAASPTPSR